MPIRPAAELGNVINVYRETEVSLRNFQDILETPREPKPANPVAVEELRTLGFDGVRFAHKTASAPALSDVSFEVARGQTLAFVGPSGAGKTTLVKLLVGLYARHGRILYNGHPSDTVELDSCASASASSPRHPALRGHHPREPALRPTDATDAQCLDVLHKAQCDSLLARADRGSIP